MLRPRGAGALPESARALPSHWLLLTMLVVVSTTTRWPARVEGYSGTPLVGARWSSSVRHASLMSLVEEHQDSSFYRESSSSNSTSNSNSLNTPPRYNGNARPDAPSSLPRKVTAANGRHHNNHNSLASHNNGQRRPWNNQGGHPLSSKHSSSTPRANPSDDPAFLRKRTSHLLSLTLDAADTAATATTTAPATSTSTDGGRAERLSPVPKHFKADKKTFHFLMDAWAFSGEPDADEQAQALLEHMHRLQLQPDVRSYTKVMNALARSGKQSAGLQAESLLEQMAFLSSTRGTCLQPNTFSYTALVEAYANSGAPGSAFKADQWCQEMLHKYQKGDASVIPTSRAFHAVITAYGKSGEPQSGARAQATFDRMEQLWHETQLDECKPTAFNYNALITAWANCPESGSAPRAHQVLQRMEQLYRAGNLDLKPTTVTFNAVIDAYAKSAGDHHDRDWDYDHHHHQSGHDDYRAVSGAAEQAEELLRRMEALHRSGENVDARPNVRSFNSVLNVWAKSGHAEGADRAQEILDLMETLYKQGNDEVRPDVHSFCTVINAWARSPAPFKADRAWNLLREMKGLYQQGNHDHLKPNVIAYNAVLNACAFSNSNGGLVESSHAMEMAHAIFKEMEQSEGVTPDQVTYGTFLKVCANQLPDCSTRQQLVEVLFRKCIRDGQVGTLVLQQLRAMIPDELYVKLLGRSPNSELIVEELPPEWWCNVVKGKGRRKRSQQ